MGEQVLNKNGIKIKSYKAGSLYELNLGVRDYSSTIDAVLSYSLFSLKYSKNGLRIHKNSNSTRDIICIDFEFGASGFKEQIKKLTKKYPNIHMFLESVSKIKKITINETPTIKKAVYNSKLISDTNINRDHKNDYSDKHLKIFPTLYKMNKRKESYQLLSKKEIRKKYYKEGVTVTYYKYVDSKKFIGTKDEVIQVKYNQAKKTRYYKIIDEVIHYRMLYRTSAQAKQGKVIFINEKHYDNMINWMTMGLYEQMPKHNAKIVELSAYAPLTTSTLVDTIHIPIEDVFIVKDVKSTFFTKAKVIASEDVNKVKVCCVKDMDYEVSNTLWDGMGLIEDSILPEWVNGFALLRNLFFKMAGFRTYLQMFLKEWCEENGYDYETKTLTDMFGVEHFVKDIKVVTTNNAIKWLKFIDIMGGTEKKAYNYWKKKVNADNSMFGIVKTDHPSKLGEFQQASYQMINSLPATKQDVTEITDSIKEYIKLLKNDNKEFVKYLRLKANAVNHYDMLADLYEHNNEFAKSKYFASERKKILYKYIEEIQTGKLIMKGDNLTVCGNPYSLLLYITGQDYLNDLTLSKEIDCIQCYTTRFDHDEYLCAFRSPQNSYNNVMYLHNVHKCNDNNEVIMKKYFNFSDNIMAVNCIETDIQERANGEDFDSDFNYVTNNKVAVRLSKECYLNYPTVVNNISESCITYDNDMYSYAEMDDKFSQSKIGIGESSNIAQLAITYYYTELNKSEEIQNKESLKILYDIFIEMAVIAQIIIDGCKREYEIDANKEIRRARNIDVMKQHKPEFWKYINVSNKKDEEIKLLTKEEYESLINKTISNKIHKLNLELENKLIEKEIKSNIKGEKPSKEALDKIKEKYAKKINDIEVKRDLELEIMKYYYDNIFPHLRVEKGFVINDSLECPMNYAIKELASIDNKTREKIYDTKNFFIKNTDSDTNRHQVGKITSLVSDYYDFFNSNVKNINDGTSEEEREEIFTLITIELNEVMNKVQGMKISKKTVNRLVECALGIDKFGYSLTKYSRLVLSALHRTNKDKFLECFTKSNN